MTQKNALKVFGLGAVGTAFLVFFLSLGGTEQNWEFLVRLRDKTNNQVFCHNPVHKGNHMDRVFFEDATFEASCPECGGGDWLYRKNNAITKKGHFITFKPEGWSWGSNERKHYGIIKIECTYEQAQALCAGIKNVQAEADVEMYRLAGDREAERLAANRAMIDARPREHVFDFEQALTVEQLGNWKDKEKYSDVISLSGLPEVN